ncbi:dnaJ homolog subfamily C member 9-like [Oncorhynchus mykiss]|uniref:dnaJ homolog subfamily C member 9-like n=1 Tax=Oncorhynchus mykiss TaxID=8022 RepID=UPI0018787C43|nr:dnaJ homolog subfamily C member 9-like [Oncorhynchus mykiss]
METAGKPDNKETAFSLQITQQDILNFEKSYKNCEDEKHDLMRVYVEHKGDMDRIMENVLCATLEDETQIRAILKSAICSKGLQAHKAFTNARCVN